MPLEGISLPLVAEALAARERILFVSMLGLSRIQLEGDSLNLIRMIKEEQIIHQDMIYAFAEAHWIPVAEGLNWMFKQAEAHGLISGLEFEIDGLKITHLQNADDTLIFCKATLEDIQMVKRLLLELLKSEPGKDSESLILKFFGGNQCGSKDMSPEKAIITFSSCAPTLYLYGSNCWLGTMFVAIQANVHAVTETGVSALSPDQFFLAPSLTLSVASGSLCSDSVFPNNQVFASCTDLPNLDSFLHWTYTPSSSTLRIAYCHSQVSSSTWVAWGINPTSKGMIGTQVIVAYQKPDGTFTSPVDSYGTRLQEGNLTFPVSDLSAMLLDNEMVIFATIELPENTTSINHVWQDGPVSGDNLGMHGVSGNHLQSMGNLNLSSGQGFGSHGGNSKTKLKIVSY
ncbi:hypothetical protein RHSIM_Rhsim02G0102700 [Rhododendron simsii]|uniref:DOMON domain-containing protein n=1 Tax=Rhododendron simsii TaxID=118357 RepID=A0A834H9Z6_RHOSS|nr:hypothetical protein RHSIM_Rhsim02G0102700 [Rhododendron simsii]